jgi:hypothetical protein
LSKPVIINNNCYYNKIFNIFFDQIGLYLDFFSAIYLRRRSDESQSWFMATDQLWICQLQNLDEERRLISPDFHRLLHQANQVGAIVCESNGGFRPDDWATRFRGVSFLHQDVQILWLNVFNGFSSFLSLFLFSIYEIGYKRISGQQDS